MDVEIKDNNIGGDIRPVLPECYRCSHRFTRINHMCALDIMVNRLFKNIKEHAMMSGGKRHFSFKDVCTRLTEEEKDSDRTIMMEESVSSSFHEKNTYRCVSSVSEKNYYPTYMVEKKIVFKRNAIDAIIKIHDNFMPYVDEVYRELSKRRLNYKRRNDNGRRDVSNGSL